MALWKPLGETTPSGRQVETRSAADRWRRVGAIAAAWIIGGLAACDGDDGGGAGPVGVGGAGGDGAAGAFGGSGAGAPGGGGQGGIGDYQRPEQLPWLDDFADLRPLGPVLPGQTDLFRQPYPKTLGSGPLSPGQMAKYTMFTSKNASVDEVATAQQNHGAEHPFFLLWVSSRAWQGSVGSISQSPNFEADGDTSVGSVADGRVFPGHWAYRNRTTLQTSISASGGSTITATLASAASAYHTGRYVRFVRRTGPDQYDWSHTTACEITAVAANTITCQVAPQSTRHAFQVGDYGFAHERGQTELFHFWAWNIATSCPRDASGQSASEFLAGWIATHQAADAQGNATSAHAHGYLSDADSYNVVKDMDLDLDGDNDPQGFDESGTALWGEGQSLFYEQLRAAWPEAAITSGADRSPISPGADGNQLEGAPDEGMTGRPDPEYGKVSQRIAYAQAHLRFNGGGADTTHFYSKITDHQYSFDDAGSPLLRWTHGEFAGALASVLGIYYGRRRAEGSSGATDTWYDFMGVDIGQGTFTDGPNADGGYGFGVAVAMASPTDLVRAKGWLGHPLGMAYRIYDNTAFADGAEAYRWSADTDPTGSGWEVVSNAQLSMAAGALEVVAPLSWAGEGMSSAAVRTTEMVGSATAGQPTTVAIRMRTRQPDQWRRVRLRACETFIDLLIGWESRPYVLTLPCESSGESRLVVSLGQHLGVDTLIEELRIYHGADPNVFARDFEHGKVLVNATASDATITLDDGYRRYLGFQNPANDGSAVGPDISLAPYTAVFLIRQ